MDIRNEVVFLAFIRYHLKLETLFMSDVDRQSRWLNSCNKNIVNI